MLQPYAWEVVCDGDLFGLWDRHDTFRPNCLNRWSSLEDQAKARNSTRDKGWQTVKAPVSSKGFRSAYVDLCPGCVLDLKIRTKENYNE